MTTVLWIDDSHNVFTLYPDREVTGVEMDPGHWILCEQWLSPVFNEDVPAALFLDQNFPNPFNPSTTISFGLDEDGPVLLQVFDITGALVKTLEDRSYPAGNYTSSWHGTNESGRRVASGIYLYRLRAGGREITKKMILIR